MSRAFLIRRTILLCCFLLPLCLGASAWGGEVDVEFWTTEEEPERMATIRYLADDFMAFHDGVRITVVAVNENEMPGTYADAVAMGAAPQLVNTTSEQLVSFGTSGWLDGEAARTVAISVGMDRFFSGAAAMLSAGKDGGLWAVPMHGWVQGIWYRADWFSAFGLEPPASFDAILAAAKLFHAPQDGVYGLLLGTKRDMYTEQCFTHLALAEGARLIDDAGNVVFNSPETVRALEQYRELAAYAPEGPQNWRARDYYLQGKMAMMFYSTFIMDDLALSSAAAPSLTGDNFADLKGAPFDPRLIGKTEMVSLLHGERKAGYGVISGLGFGKGMTPAQREAALEFAQYLYRPDVYTTWLQMAPGGMLPVLRDAVENEEFYRDIGGVFRRYSQGQVRRMIAGLERMGSFSMHDGKLSPRASRISAAGIIPNMVHKVVFEGMEPARAVRWAEERMRAVK